MSKRAGAQVGTADQGHCPVTPRTQRFVSEINGEQDTTGRFQRILCGTDARSGQRHRSADDRKQRRHPSWYTDLRGVQRQHH